MPNPISFDFLKTEDVAQALMKAGIKQGDVVCVHSFLGAFGRFENGAKTVLDGFLSVIGHQGTLVIPTYNYDFCMGVPYDADKTPSQVGQFTEFCRLNNEFRRTFHPVYSHVVTGAQAGYFLDNPSVNGLGVGSTFDRLHELDAHLVCLGVSFSSLTFFHYMEDRLEVPYRFMKEFPGQVMHDGKLEPYTAKIYSRYLELDPPAVLGLKKIQEEFIHKKIAKKTLLGRGEIISVRARDCFLAAEAEYKKNNMCFLKEPVLLSQIKNR